VTLLVALGLFIDYTLLTVVVPIFPEVKKNLKLSNFAIGCLFAVKPALQAIADPLLAPLIDRGWVWPLAVGLAAEAGTTVIFAYATTYEAMMVSRATQGIASALIMTTGLAMVARVHNDDDKQRGIALSRAFFGVAGTCTVPMEATSLWARCIHTHTHTTDASIMISFHPPQRASVWAHPSEGSSTPRAVR
jgi:predicted MFS family arabinose efflux permease